MLDRYRDQYNNRRNQVLKVSAHAAMALGPLARPAPHLDITHITSHPSPAAAGSRSTNRPRTSLRRLQATVFRTVPHVAFHGHQMIRECHRPLPA